MENQESSVNTEAITADDINMDSIDNTQSIDIYKVQPRRNKALKSIALNILKYLPEDILREEPDFSSIKSNNTIQDYGPCGECDIPILTEDPPRSLVLNVCGDMIHRTCAKKIYKDGALLCSCGMTDNSDPLLPFRYSIVDYGGRPEKEKSSISESERPSLVNLRNLGYNILKSLEDKTVRDIDSPELGPCSECSNDILTPPLKEFTYLKCGHLFHRLCIEKKLFLGAPSICPFPGCEKNVDILEEADAFGVVSNMQDSSLSGPKGSSHSSGVSPLYNMMSERFILSSPIIRMEGIENTGFQQARSYLRCAKCSEDLSSCLPPISFLRIPPQVLPQAPPKPLVYLTCKHIVHYHCIDDPRKQCPICPSTDMELDVDGEEQPDNNSKKRTNEDTDANSSTPKKKAKKPVRREDSPILKKLIKELSAPIPQQSSSGSTISLQTFPDMNIESVNFRELNDRIIKAEDDNKRTVLELIHSYYYFGKGYRLWFDHYKKKYSDDTSNSLVNDKIREYFPDQDKTSEANLRKRKEKAIKIFKLFEGVGGVDKINCIKSFSASTISRLSVEDIEYVIAKVLKAGQ